MNTSTLDLFIVTQEEVLLATKVVCVHILLYFFFFFFSHDLSCIIEPIKEGPARLKKKSARYNS